MKNRWTDVSGGIVQAGASLTDSSFCASRAYLIITKIKREVGCVCLVFQRFFCGFGNTLSLVSLSFVWSTPTGIAYMKYASNLDVKA